MLLRVRYASLVSQLAVSIAFQSVLPILAPVTALGLMMRYWIERSAFLRNQLVRQQELSFHASQRMILTASVCLWVGIVSGSALAVWVFGETTLAGMQVEPKDSFLARGLTDSALPAFAVLCFSLCIPVCSGLVLLVRHLFPRALSEEEPGSMNYQEAWLIMTHNEQICTYQLRDMPGDRGASVLDSLQEVEGSQARFTERGPNAAAPSYLSREGDVTPALAVVGDKAPTRGKALASKMPYIATESQVKRPQKDQQAEYWSQLRSVATVSPVPLGRSSQGEQVREAV